MKYEDIRLMVLDDLRSKGVLQEDKKNINNL